MGISHPFQDSHKMSIQRSRSVLQRDYQWEGICGSCLVVSQILGSLSSIRECFMSSEEKFLQRESSP
jgi:hypothetical protein